MSIPLTKPTITEARATHKEPVNIANCYLSQFKEDTGEPAVSAHEISLIAYTYHGQMTRPGFEFLSLRDGAIVRILRPTLQTTTTMQFLLTGL